LTIYRDGCRKSQVLLSGDSTQIKEVKAEKVQARPRKRPRIVKGVTERINTGDGTLYVTINEDADGLCEVFATIGKHGANASAYSEAICRLISLCLRCGIEARSVIKQLKGIAGPNPVWDDGQLILSPPDAIGKLLEKYISRKGELKDNKFDKESPKLIRDQCPDCGDFMVYEEGCITCKSCGFSRCS
jgi:ribonucleoside-diphosphate reductase alpha chain